MTWPGGGGGSGPTRRSWWDTAARAPHDTVTRHRTSRGEPVDILPEETILYRDAQGRSQRMQARVTDYDPPLDPLYRTRLVVDIDTHEEYTQKRAHGAGRRPAGALPRSVAADGIDALDNEIQIGLHLADAFGGHRTYPRELSRIVGRYHDDGDQEPFILVAERGRPVEWFAGRLLLDQSERFAPSLLRALELLDAAGVVHRCLTTASVRFDDRYVQVTDFRHAVLTGERCGPAPEPDWAAPEALEGLAPASPKEDIYSAGLVLRRVIQDGLGSVKGSVRERRRGGGGLLERIFQFYPEDRPTASEALNNLDARRDGPPPAPRRPVALSEPRFVEGARRFELIRRRRATEADSDGGR